MTQDDFIRQIAEARASMQELAKLYPGCFHEDGRPIVASALLPGLSRSARMRAAGFTRRPSAKALPSDE